MAEPPTRHSARDARGGEIVLRRPWQRLIFFGALAAATLVGILAVLI